jgi:MerR family transcriptional regulator, mercuric resistance operon regulatory protein
MPDTNPRGGMTIGALSRATGCNIETIRYYERIGVLAKSPRTAGGRRIYGDAAIQHLRFVRRGRELGFSLDEVRALAALAKGGGHCGEVRALTLHHLAEVKAKIRDLRRLAATLSTTAALCRGGKAPKCPILDILT